MDKPIPEAIELLRAFQSHYGPRRPDYDEDDAATWDRIDAVCEALTAAQQPAQVAPGDGRKMMTVYRSRKTGRIVGKHYARTHPNDVTANEQACPNPPKATPPGDDAAGVDRLWQWSKK